MQNESRILAQVRMMLQEGGGTARIQLEPPQLGELKLRLTITNDSIRLSVLTEKPVVAELFTRHLPELRQALELQGLQVERADVDVRDQDDRSEPHRQAESAERDHERGRGSARHDEAAEDGDADLHMLRPVPLEGLGSVSVHV